MTDPEWMLDAECRNTEPNLFFPGRGDDDTVKRAKAVCAECPVRAECLDYALAGSEKFGIWGGLSERERRAIRRRRRKPLRELRCPCGARFTANSSSARYCGDACALDAKRANQARWQQRNGRAS